MEKSIKLFMMILEGLNFLGMPNIMFARDGMSMYISNS